MINNITYPSLFENVINYKYLYSYHFKFSADDWPQVFDDSEAREDWNWKSKYDLPKLVTSMIEDVNRYYTINK